MSDNFELVSVDLEDFKENIQKNIEEKTEVEEDEFLKPDSISYQEALREAKVMLNDFSEESSVRMVIFEYEDGYQVDIVNGPSEYEIYDGLYNAEDVVSVVLWKYNKKEVQNLN